MNLGKQACLDDIQQINQILLPIEFFFPFSLCLGGNTYMYNRLQLPALRQSHIPFLGRLCMPAPSVCFWIPRLWLCHPGSFTSVHEFTRAEDVALPQELYTHVHTAHARAGPIE